MGNLSDHSDSYLLALAVANNGKLVTFDQKLAVNAVIDGSVALKLI